jgi:hypothetical protein
MNARPHETRPRRPTQRRSIAVRVWKPPTQITGIRSASLKRRA